MRVARDSDWYPWVLRPKPTRVTLHSYSHSAFTTVHRRDLSRLTFTTHRRPPRRTLHLHIKATSTSYTTVVNHSSSQGDNHWSSRCNMYDYKIVLVNGLEIPRSPRHRSVKNEKVGAVAALAVVSSQAGGSACMACRRPPWTVAPASCGEDRMQRRAEASCFSIKTDDPTPGLLAIHPKPKNHPFLFSLLPLQSQNVMGTPQRVLVLAPWALLLLALQLAAASHVIHRSLEAEAAPPSVPSSIVSPLLRTGYHFQPPRNWINGMR
ncbi:hypothetical protein HU200_038703 [Digitaria exilis]|uniref:Uncharacterized protein n=1 Tax=Digitaria exilis TaxID=1010633 RepID=A0A835BBQ1_9POAL|nr:hypothetical protein HU200_038703 [Digitaria exilis]